MIRCVLDAKAYLGEGPLWDELDQVLYWVDIKRRQVHRFDPSTGRDDWWMVDQDVGSLAVREQGGLALALADGLYGFSPESGELQPLMQLEADCPGNRFNDGKPDRQGRFWVGSMDDNEREPTGSLYRLDTDLRWEQMVTGLTISNSLCFSADGRKLYHSDSARQMVWVWTCDPNIGAIYDQREFVRLNDGYPDGATIDANDNLWLAVWDGWRVECYDPAGELQQCVSLPVQCPTCPAFGGPAMQTLFVTSASKTVTDWQRQPQAGGVFAFEPGVAGIAERRFGG